MVGIQTLTAFVTAQWAKDKRGCDPWIRSFSLASSGGRKRLPWTLLHSRHDVCSDRLSSSADNRAGNSIIPGIRQHWPHDCNKCRRGSVPARCCQYRDVNRIQIVLKQTLLDPGGRKPRAKPRPGVTAPRRKKCRGLSVQRLEWPVRRHQSTN